MNNSKDILKDLGERLRGSNESHRARLRAQLEAQAPQTHLVTSSSLAFWKQWLTLGTGALAMLAIVIATHHEPEVYTYAPPSGSLSMNLGLEDKDEVTGLASEQTIADGLVTRDDYDYEPSPAPVKSGAAVGGVVDYEQEHGSMLEKTTTIALKTSTPDAVGKVESLFTSLGGHLSSISNYGLGQPSTLTGVVPADSYFLFREQLHDLVKADKFIFESLNADDLIPSAIEIDDNIEQINLDIEATKHQIQETKNSNERAKLEDELGQYYNQLEDLQASRDDLDDRASFVNVSITVYDLPSFWEVGDQYELSGRVTGFEQPSFVQQVWINILIAGFWFLQVFSVTFWLIIPLIIWLISRRRQRKAWKELE